MPFSASLLSFHDLSSAWVWCARVLDISQSPGKLHQDYETWLRAVQHSSSVFGSGRFSSVVPMPFWLLSPLLQNSVNLVFLGLPTFGFPLGSGQERVWCLETSAGCGQSTLTSFRDFCFTSPVCQISVEHNIRPPDGEDGPEMSVCKWETGRRVHRCGPNF